MRERERERERDGKIATTHTIVGYHYNYFPLLFAEW